MQPEFKGIFMYCPKQGFNRFLQFAIFTSVFPTETKQHAEKTHFFRFKPNNLRQVEELLTYFRFAARWMLLCLPSEARGLMWGRDEEAC